MCKAVLVGDVAVGKSCLINRFVPDQKQNASCENIALHQ